MRCELADRRFSPLKFFKCLNNNTEGTVLVIKGFHPTVTTYYTVALLQRSIGCMDSPVKALDPSPGNLFFFKNSKERQSAISQCVAPFVSWSSQLIISAHNWNQTEVVQGGVNDVFVKRLKRNYFSGFSPSLQLFGKPKIHFQVGIPLLSESALNCETVK